MLRYDLYLLKRGLFCYNRSNKENYFMLTGNQLIKTIKENADLSKSDIVKVCGYTSVRKDGSIKLNYTQFYQELLSIQEVF